MLRGRESHPLTPEKRWLVVSEYGFFTNHQLLTTNYPYRGASLTSPCGGELGPHESVQNVLSKWMPFQQRRVVEVVAGRVSHADSFHHPPGADVSRNRERNDLLQLQRRE